MARSRQQAIADAITRRVMDNQRKPHHWQHTRDIVNAVHEEFFNMNGSTTMSGLNVQSNDVVVTGNKQAQPLKNPQQQQAEALDVRTGSSMADPYLAKPNSNGEPFDSPTRGLNAGLATDATCVPDMALGSSVKQVDYKTIEGSNPGDHRGPRDTAPGITDEFQKQCGPRCQMPGQQNSKFYKEDGKAFKSTPVGLDSEAGN